MDLPHSVSVIGSPPVVGEAGRRLAPHRQAELQSCVGLYERMGELVEGRPAYRKRGGCPVFLWCTTPPLHPQAQQSRPVPPARLEELRSCLGVYERLPERIGGRPAYCKRAEPVRYVWYTEEQAGAYKWCIGPHKGLSGGWVDVHVPKTLGAQDWTPLSSLVPRPLPLTLSVTLTLTLTIGRLSAH